MRLAEHLLLRRLLSATILAAGFACVWLIVVAVLGAIVLQRFFTREPLARESLVIARDGSTLIETRRGRGVDGYRNLDGTPRTAVSQPSLVQPIGLMGTRDVDAINFFFTWGRFPWDWRLKPFEDDLHKATQWFFVHDGRENGSGYFVGYNWANHERLGFIGESGFSTRPLTPEQGFRVKRESMIWSQWSSVLMTKGPEQLDRAAYQIKSRVPSHCVYVPSDNGVRLVDLAQRTVQTVFETRAPIESIQLANELPNATDPTAQRPAIFVRTAQAIYALNNRHRVVREFAVSDESEREHVAMWYQMPDGRAVVSIRRGWTQSSVRDAVYRLAADGTVDDRHEVELPLGDLAWNQTTDGLLFAWALPIPAVLPLAQPLFMVRRDMADGYFDAWQLMLRDSWVALVGVAAISLAFAVAAWRHSGHFALPFPERVAWTAFVASCGLPGFVGYRLHRRWPIQDECPLCHAMTPLEAGACASCERRFPGPAPKGIEVFA